MYLKELEEVLDELDEFNRKFACNEAKIYLYDTSSNREFINFANMHKKYKNIKLIIKFFR